MKGKATGKSPSRAASHVLNMDVDVDLELYTPAGGTSQDVDGSCKSTKPTPAAPKKTAATTKEWYADVPKRHVETTKSSHADYSKVLQELATAVSKTSPKRDTVELWSDVLMANITDLRINKTNKQMFFMPVEHTTPDSFMILESSCRFIYSSNSYISLIY